MKSYVESDDYRTAQRTFYEMYHDLYNELPALQQKKLTALAHARDDLVADLAGEAYYRGVIHGIQMSSDAR